MSEIKDLIQNALDQDYNKASEVFGEIMSVKMSDLLDQEKIKLAGQIYNGEEPEEDTDEELADISDEELDAALEGDDDESEEDEVSEEDEDEASDDDEE